MSSLFPFGFVMPTDGPMPPAAIAPDVATQYGSPFNYPYHEGVNEAEMSRFQWLARGFTIEVECEVRIRGNGGQPDGSEEGHMYEFQDADIPFSFNSGPGAPPLITRHTTVAGKFPTGPFAAGGWAAFTVLEGEGENVIPGSHRAFEVLEPSDVYPDPSIYEFTDYTFTYYVEIGAFNVGRPLYGAPITDEPHVIEVPNDPAPPTYKIPFFVVLDFSATVAGITGEPTPPVTTTGTTSVSRWNPSLITGLYTFGTVDVTNGEVELFPPASPQPGFSMAMDGRLADKTSPNTCYFESLNIQIKAKTLAALPS